jgi:hypothetical protein
MGNSFCIDNNNDDGFKLFEEIIEDYRKKGNMEVVKDMEEQRDAILENRKMTYCEMRELMG